ncbi:cell division protein ZapA [Sphingomonas sp. LY54]|uniref:cell division protein ZapA n=1 Tax=Sphingomonas sp. LY54 TaxID=3095343 RepID=UPI002D798BB9|nr:cell division protein ZapA [Sphingomonas sp. LY54]WRP28636.1 cell division protein ZapA [Sphingomonas sp. LY54]
MPSVEIEIAGRRYNLACRDGEQEHMRSVAVIVDEKARQAGEALGSLSEARQLLFASLLLADSLQEQQEAAAAGPAPAAQPAVPDAALTDALERLAEQVEALAERLEGKDAKSYIGSRRELPGASF